MEHEPIAPMLVISGLARYQRLCRPHARQVTTGVGQILSLTNGGEQLMAAMGTRGRLRILLGSGPGASTTCAMFGEAHRRAERGTDVVAYAPAPVLVCGIPAGSQFAHGGAIRLPSAMTASRPGVVVTQAVATAVPPSRRSSLPAGTRTTSPLREPRLSRPA
jgi:hypothetical protein